MRRGCVEFKCAIAAKPVSIGLRHGGGLGEPEGAYVYCDERDCQYADLNQPPCPLCVAMFQGESDDRVALYLAQRAGRRVCYGCVTDALAVDHEQVRKASWRLKSAPGFGIGPSRCSECRRRRVTIGFAPGTGVTLPIAAEPANSSPAGLDAPRLPRLPLEPPAIGSEAESASTSVGALEALLQSQAGYWLCAHCIARELGRPVADVRDTLDTLERRGGLRMRTAQCVSCLLMKRVGRLETASSEGSAGARILNALFESGGDPMCATCLAFATDAGLAEVKRVVGYLETMPEFDSRMATCTVCSRWQAVVVGIALDAGPDRVRELRALIAGIDTYRGFRIELLSYRTRDGWRPFALIRTATSALVPDMPSMLLGVASSKVEADGQAAAAARAWIDKRCRE